jgi:hypothetical protein
MSEFHFFMIKKNDSIKLETMSLQSYMYYQIK